jgi:hypothetical protein
MHTKLKQRRLGNLFRFLLVVEVVALLLASGFKWVLYRAYMNHTCSYSSLGLRWKDAVFCVDRRDVWIWEAVNAALLIALVALIITSILAAVWNFLKER